MVTHIFADFDVEQPKRHPINGDLVIAFKDPDTNQVFIFPMPEEPGVAMYHAIGKALGLEGGVILPTNSQVHNVTRNR